MLSLMVPEKIRKPISCENPLKPVDVNKIAKIFNDSDIDIAHRTKNIGKYYKY